jgi:hypothetical protein
MCRVCESAATVTAAANNLVVACNTKVSLRRYWSAVLKEPVPTDVTELLRRLD